MVAIFRPPGRAVRVVVEAAKRMGGRGFTGAVGRRASTSSRPGTCPGDCTRCGIVASSSRIRLFPLGDGGGGNNRHRVGAPGNFSIRPIHTNPPSRRDPFVDDVLRRLRRVGTGPLCDVDKAYRLDRDDAGGANAPGSSYPGLRLMCPLSMRPRNAPLSPYARPRPMVGVARTVQLPRPNDFLAVLHALSEARQGDVLVVNAAGSTRAVAGGLFAAEASRRGLAGLVVDGPIRDLDDLDGRPSEEGSDERRQDQKRAVTASPVRVYSTSVTPYSGTVQYPGEGVDVAPVICGGVEVSPGDVVFGDSDGVLVGCVEAFATCLSEAENIATVERKLMEGMNAGASLHTMMNFEEHLCKRRQGIESTLRFNKDLHTTSFDAMDLIRDS